MNHRLCLTLALVVFISFGSTAALAQLPGVGTGNRFYQLDAHALKAPAAAEASVKALAEYLTEPAKDDLEKARVIFCWVANKIQYDAERLRAGKIDRNLTAEEVLEKRLGVCGCYANLVKGLCDAVGLEAVVIRGYSKNATDPPGTDYKSKNRHAWNAVKIDGQWQFLEPTWASGQFVNDKFVHRYEDIHFLMPPEQFIFTHFPVEEKWQLLPEPLSYQQFVEQPLITANLFKLGFTWEQIQQKIKDGTLREPVKTYQLPKNTRIHVREAPVEQHLEAGKSYRFVIEAEGVLTIAVKIKGQYRPAAQTAANTYAGVVPITPGTFHIYAVLANPANPRARVFTPILTYQGELRAASKK